MSELQLPIMLFHTHASCQQMTECKLTFSAHSSSSSAPPVSHIAPALAPPLNAEHPRCILQDFKQSVDGDGHLS